MTAGASGVLLASVVWLVADWAISDPPWGVVTSNMRLFLGGLSPQDQVWRIAVALTVTSVLAGLSTGTWHSSAVRSMAVMLAAGGGCVGRILARPRLWGGGVRGVGGSAR